MTLLALVRSTRGSWINFPNVLLGNYTGNVASLLMGGEYITRKDGTRKQWRLLL